MEKSGLILLLFSFVVGLSLVSAQDDFDVDWGTNVECGDGDADEIEAGVEYYRWHLAHAPLDIRMANHFDAEAVGDAFDGHVVMGRADAA